MKFFVVFAVALACAAADVSHLKPSDDYNAPIVKSIYEITPEGAFQYGYETGNGIIAKAAGEVRNPNSEYPSLAVQGGYKYFSPEGTPIELSYTADEEGFKPVGSHLPVPPEIPELILRSLAYIAAHPPAPESSRPVGPVQASQNYGK